MPAHEQWGDEGGEWGDTPTAAVVDDSSEQGLAGAPSDSLDDDAFFASLREAVRDDTPLGSRDTTATEQFYDGDEPDDQRKLFRRRR